MTTTDTRAPTPIEVHQGVSVKREDLVDDVMPNGKLRGVLPYLRELHDQGTRHVVNAGASHSNSHALVARVCQLLRAEGRDMDALCVTNTKNLTYPNLAYATALGATVEYGSGPHLAPLLAAARRAAAGLENCVMLPWGLAGPQVIDGIADAVAEVPPGPWLHITPFGAGSYTAAVYRGLVRGGRLAHQGGQEHVVGVAAMGLRPSAVLRVRELAGIEPEVLPHRLALVDLALIEGRPPGKGESPPWPCDRHYEWKAWPSALDMARQGQWRVLLWSVGRSPW